MLFTFSTPCLSLSRLRVVLLSAFLLIALSVSAWAQAGSVVFTTNTTISASNFAYEDYAVTVRGCTVTIDGTHAFHSLTIENNGIVTHTAVNSSLNLIIATDVTVNTGSRISGDGRGYSVGEGPGAGAITPSNNGGGASHGGEGGSGLGGSSIANCYGSIMEPTELGSGGGRSDGGAGGGAIRLTVTGTLAVNGTISANGVRVNVNAGAGSGGSLWLEAGTLTGNGFIQANGGNIPNANQGGGGGGGRIAVYFDSNSFTGSIQAYGGTGYGTDAGAGTIYLKADDAPGTVIVDNNNKLAGITQFREAVTLLANLIVRNGGIVGPPALSDPYQNPDFHLTVQGNVTIDANGRIAADGRGYGVGTGPGAGAITPSNNGSGASHGGEGGSGLGGSPIASCYGSIMEPTELGSGGGRSDGGAGGGALRLSVTGTLTVNGVISANGTRGHQDAGGGSGGSLWLEAGTLAGNGFIQANGGNIPNANQGGGGGGGRIAVYFDSNSFTGSTQAYGGTGYGTDAGAGTVYLKVGDAPGTVIVDNNNNLSGTTQLNGVQNLGCNLIVRGAGILGTQYGIVGTHWTFLNVTIQSGGYIRVDGRGFRAEMGPGAGAVTPNNHGNGGSYGGVGGRGNSRQIPIAIPYGSVSQPIDMGSGGGRSTGGAGGGAIRLTVTETLTVNGIFSANGANGAAQTGGGSGGSLWIETGMLTGTGFIQANGGNSPAANGGGGGGGGRIAIYSPNRSLPLANITANGGTGAEAGCPGTVYTGVIRGISGRVTLEDAADPQQPVTFELRQSSRCIYVTTLTLPADGSFLLPEVLPGQYTLAIKGTKWLRKTFPIDTRNGDVTGLTAFLITGDANDDNSVDVLDLDLLIQAFDNVEGDPSWNNGVTDFNCDGSVDVLDLDLLIRNFDQSGDP